MADARKFSLGQTLTQIGVKFVASGTAPFWLMDFSTNIENPAIKSMYEVSIVPIASILVDEAYALLYQADPTAHWRAIGGDNRMMGGVKLASVRGFAVGGMLTGGYLMAKFSMKFMPKLFQSHNPAAHFLAEVLASLSYREGALAVVTYAGCKGITVIGLKVWNCFIPEREYAAGTWDEPHAVQRFLSYAVRLALTMPMAETIFYYLTDQNLGNLAANWRFQSAMFASLHAALWTADNYAARPEQPVSQDIEAAEVPKTRGIRWQYIVPAALMMGSYVLSEALCAYMNLLEDPAYCKKNTLAARSGRFVVSVGIPVCSYYAITDFIPRTNFFKTCHHFFNRAQPVSAEGVLDENQALLRNVVAGK